MATSSGEAVRTAELSSEARIWAAQAAAPVSNSSAALSVWRSPGVT